MAELDALVGPQRVKSEVHRQVAVLRVEKLRTGAGLTSPIITRHLVFSGNPGTGKTTVARLVGGIYEALGFPSRGHLVEVNRSELVAGYLGQTDTKTADVVVSASGGVLFIDELGEDGSVSPAAASQVVLASAELDPPAATRTTEVCREHPHAYDDLQPSSGPKRRAPTARAALEHTRGLARH